MAEEQKRKFELRKIYVKDISFESPLSPRVFATEKFSPSIDVQLNVNHNMIRESIYETVLIVTVNGKLDDKDAFLAEVHQAGVYEIAGIEPESALNTVLEVACPNMLFPFAREAINDLVVRGGFPQLLLTPVNFEVLYRHKLQNEVSDGENTQGKGKSKKTKKKTSAKAGTDGAAS